MKVVLKMDLLMCKDQTMYLAQNMDLPSTDWMKNLM